MIAASLYLRTSSRKFHGLTVTDLRRRTAWILSRRAGQTLRSPFPFSFIKLPEIFMQIAYVSRFFDVRFVTNRA
jgi:hypothetical protein